MRYSCEIKLYLWRQSVFLFQCQVDVSLFEYGRLDEKRSLVFILCFCFYLCNRTQHFFFELKFHCLTVILAGAGQRKAHQTSPSGLTLYVIIIYQSIVWKHFLSLQLFTLQIESEDIKNMCKIHAMMQ